MLRIRAIRERTGKMQKTVAKDLGIGLSTYNQYETGKREPDNATLLKLANYFNVSIDYLLGNSDDPASTSTQKKPLSLEEIEAMYLQALIDNDIVSPDKPMSEETRKRLEDSVKLAIRIATEQALKDK